MLTRDDIVTLRKVVREEVETEGRNIRDELNSRIITSRMRIQEDIRELSDRTKNVEIRLTGVEKTVKKIAKKLDRTSDFLDREVLKDRKRINKIEEHLDFPRT